MGINCPGMLVLTTESILQLTSGLGIIQGMLLASLVFFHPKSDRSVNIFLSFYVFVLSIVMVGPMLFQYIPWYKTFYLEPLPYLAGPLLYLYVRSFREKITFSRGAPHFIMYIVFFVVSWQWVSYLADKNPGLATIPEEAFRSPVALFSITIRYIHLIVYYVLTVGELKAYRRSIRQFFSETSTIDLRWGRWLVNGYLFLVVSSIVIAILMISFMDWFYFLYMINMAIATPYIYALTYWGITQPTVWQKQAGTDKQTIEKQMQISDDIGKATFDRRRIQKPPVNEIKVSEIVSRTIFLMEKVKMYQETELTLKDLADKLQYPPHQVSYAINEGLKKNFYDLINSYRVEEAKRLLLDKSNRNFTILSVGFDAGFNSKTTFNTVFKKFTGVTPTDFRNAQKMNLTVTL